MKHLIKSFIVMLFMIGIHTQSNIILAGNGDPFIYIPKRDPNSQNPHRMPGKNVSVPASFNNGVLEISLNCFEIVEHGYVKVYNLDRNYEETVVIGHGAETVSVMLTDLPSTYVINVSVNDQLFSGTYFFTN